MSDGTRMVTITIALDDLYMAAAACEYAASEKGYSMESHLDLDDDKADARSWVEGWNMAGDNIEAIIREVAA